MSAEFDDEEAPPELIDVSAMPAEPAEEPPAARVPITLVTGMIWQMYLSEIRAIKLTSETGYLGAGKTTLLNYILTEKHGKKIAVIMNATDIEKPMTVNEDGREVTEWMEVGNGCICCSVKDTGVMAIESLMERRGTFDYILLETTGLADPGNIAPIFWMDEGLGSSIYLDGIVTLVDAKNITRLLDEPAPEEKAESHDQHHDHGSGPVLSMAHMQISHADVVILNKTDLVTEQELEAVRDRVASINSVAKIHVTDHSRTPQIEGVVLDLHAYDHLADLDFSKKGHSHMDPAISTTAIVTPPIPADKVSCVDEWLRSVLWDTKFPAPPTSISAEPHPDNFEIHRLKGILILSDGTSRIIQAVRDVFEIRDAEPIDTEDKSKPLQCKIVLIGRGLGSSVEPWRESFEACLAK
ncbi:unnamed protein product [Penicillium olsonii]|uniref:CobW/HypB/UreG nucleotide-binding domain-containing protein n=1 Tax=Penicillium olsonii TaxID=99116 RepID=A0A9W4HBP1_PENOL|nr:unnamed protein product [Penicillium olsonii]CAG7974742.1 unnamed protein product [Penicillium olsonii]